MSRDVLVKGLERDFAAADGVFTKQSTTPHLTASIPVVVTLFESAFVGRFPPAAMRADQDEDASEDRTELPIVLVNRLKTDPAVRTLLGVPPLSKEIETF
jgi:hypothetical protein